MRRRAVIPETGRAESPYVEGMAAPYEELGFSLEAWSADGARWEEVLARVTNVGLAHAAFDFAMQARPASRILIRHGTRVIRDSADDRRRRLLQI